MPDLVDLLLLLLSGAAGGFLSGLLGVGGGIIFIPILDLVLNEYGMEQEAVKFILANSLAVIIFTGAFNSYRQWKAGNFFLKYILYTALPGVVSVLVFSYFIAKGHWYDKKTFNIIFSLLLLPGVVRMFIRKRNVMELHRNIPPIRFGIVGFVTGIFTAFSGLGGGIIMIPAFVNTLKLEMKKATSVSAGVVPFFALPTVLYYMTVTPEFVPADIKTIGFLVYPVVIPMIIGTLITVPFGVKTGHKMPATSVKIIFAVFVLLVVGKMLFENFFHG